MRSMMLSLCLLAVSTAAFAADKVPMREVQANGFDDQRAAIVAGFADEGAYSEIGTDEKAKVMGALDRMSTTLGSATSLDQLKPDARVALFNDQEIVNTILTRAQADSRITCKRDRTVSTRVKSSQCHTVAEWARRAEDARRLSERSHSTLQDRGR